MLNRTAVISLIEREKITTWIKSLVEAWAVACLPGRVSCEVRFNNILFNSTTINSDDVLYCSNPSQNRGLAVAKNLKQALILFMQSGSEQAFDLQHTADKNLMDAIVEQQVSKLMGALKVHKIQADNTNQVTPSVIDSCIEVTVNTSASAFTLIFDPVFLAGFGFARNETSVKNKALVKRQHAIQKKTVSLDVNLSHLKIDVGTLSSLKLGQVLMLDHDLDQTMNITLDKQAVPINAYLVKKENKKAILATIKEI